MVTPVDISQEGEQIFLLVASNIYCGHHDRGCQRRPADGDLQDSEGRDRTQRAPGHLPDLETAVKQNAAGLMACSGRVFHQHADDLAGDTSVLC